MKKNQFNNGARLLSLFVFSAIFTLNSLGQTVVVAPCDLNGWTPTMSGGSTTSFVNGPGTPPAGSGSVRFTVDASGATSSQMRTGIYDGQLLSNISALSYWTYVTDNNSGQATYILLNVDLDNNGTTDDQLFFEPVYQTGAYSGDPVPNQGTVMLNTWQNWNAKVGGWWSFNAFTFGPPLVTLASYIAANPGARLAVSALGSVRLVNGFGGPSDWGNFDGNADKFTIGVTGMGTTTYNFELSCPDSDGDGVPDPYDCEPNNKKKNKWLVCHNGHTICIAQPAVAAHINNHPGDYLGACTDAPRGASTEIVTYVDEFKLSNAPNPSFASTTIKYELPIDSKVNIVLYDPMGRIVGTLVDASRVAGTYNYELNTSKLAAGVYYYKMTAVAGTEKFVESQKLMIVK